jgi:hypothetical protein
MREKPSNSPPHAAKRKSMPTKAIINLVGISAVLEFDGRDWREEKM